MPSNESMNLQVTMVDNALTRSTDGDNNLNENLFVTLDYYFFASADDTEVLKVHKFETSLSDITSHTYNGKFSDDELAAVFGTNPSDGATCYVYVVANLDETTRASINNNTSITLGALKKFEFQTKDISKNEKQKSFVMYGGDQVTLSITTEGTVTKKSLYGQIKVTRDAAKVVLTVTQVKDTVHVADETIESGYQIWKSDNEHMYVMFYNGMNKSKIHSQINTGMYYLPDITDPNEDCYFTLDKTSGEDNLWRKLVAANSSEPNKNLKHQIPFYTYLSDWSEGSGYEDYASYMILVVPWMQVDANGHQVGNYGFQNTYYLIETTPINEYAYYENTFYQISINIGVLGSFVKPEPVEVTAKYMVVPWGTVDVPGTLREGRYLILETREYTMNNINSASIPYVSSHEITEATVTNVEYLALQTFEETPATHRQDGTWRTYSGSSLQLDETFTVNTDNNLLTLQHEISPNQYTRYRVTVHVVNAAGLDDTVVFTIYPAIYVSNETGGNTFVNGRFVHVLNAAGSGTGNNLPWYGLNNYNWYADETHNNEDFYITTGYGSLRFNLGTNNVVNQSLTRITVTSFNEEDSHYTLRKDNVNTTFTYKLSDPRVEDASLNSNLTNYIVTARSNRTTYTQSANQASWSGLATIKKGSDASDLIAPDFLISSAWGRTQGQNAQSFQTFERRCATYQEAGYPAGRWRIPTEAELAYIFKLQQLQVIANLFQVTNNNAYWASSGWAVNGYNNGVVSFTHTPNVVSSNTAGVRCVYDVWYWGEEKQTANEYHVMPSK